MRQLKSAFKPVFHWKLDSRWLPNANEIDTNNMKMYMPNASPSRCGPNATYIPPTCVGGWCWGLVLGVGVGVTQILVFALGGNANFNVFRYQHFGFPNAKLWRWGSKPT